MSELQTSEMRVPALPYVRAIAAYQPGKPASDVARELGLVESNIIKLASNENPLGANPRAIEAIRAVLSELARYPDGNAFALKEELAKRHNISEDSIVLGNGSNDVLELAAMAFLAPGTSAVYAQHCFVVNRLATQARGADGIEVPARDFGHDLEAMRAAVRNDTRVIFVSNPNNPTGTWIEPSQVLAFLRQVPPNVLVVLDEAYHEYLAATDQSASIEWVREFPNLLVTRTFSKATRSGRLARRLWRGSCASRGFDESCSPAVQRQQRRAGGCNCSARRHGFSANRFRIEPGGNGAVDFGV